MFLHSVKQKSLYILLFVSYKPKGSWNPAVFAQDHEPEQTQETKFSKFKGDNKCPLQAFCYYLDLRTRNFLLTDNN